MPPIIALSAWLILLLGLLYFDPARERGTSFALWVPVTWMFIVASRMPSLWFGVGQPMDVQALEEGNPLNRSIWIGLILLALAILIVRRFRWARFFAGNFALLAFLLFALVSVAWSDFPSVAFKRWVRDLGNYFVVLIILSDPNPLRAIRTVLRRLAYLLIPLSIVVIKYYPAVGRQYSRWTGAVRYVGPTTGKNSLGVLCLIAGLFFFWDIVVRWSERQDRRTRWIIRVDLAFIALTLRVLYLASSATATVCLALGCLVIAAAHSRVFQRYPGFLKFATPAAFLLYVLVAFGFNFSAVFAHAVGRDATLTDRTIIWHTLLGMHTNPLVGVGYQSFWLGSRLLWFWQNAGLGDITEAHNGYLEVYLDLGLIGLFLLGCFLFASFRKICRRLKPFSSLGSLFLAVWTVLLFYNVTEAGFRGNGLLWVTFLLGALAVPETVRSRMPAPPDFDEAYSDAFVMAPQEAGGRED